MKKISTLYKKDPSDLSRVIDVVDPNNLWVIDECVPTQKFDGTACMIEDGELCKRFDAKLRVGKQLKKLNYYIDLISVGTIVSKVSRNKFSNNELTDEVIGFGKHYINGYDTALLKNNEPIDLRQLKPIGEIPLKYFKEIPDGAIPCQEPDLISGHYPHWVKCDRNEPSDAYHFDGFDNTPNLVDGTYELCGEKIKGNPEKIIGHKLIKHGSVVLDINDFSFENLKKYLSSPCHNIEGIVFHNTVDGRMCKIRKTDFGIIR